MSEEDLLLGRVSWVVLGLSNGLYAVPLRTGSSSDGPGFGVAHYFWAGPHNSPSKLRFLSPSEEKSGVLMFNEWIGIRRAWGARADRYF